MLKNILGIFEEFGLTNLATLSNRLENFSVSNWTRLSDALDRYYATLSLNSSSVSQLVLCLPSLPLEDLGKISTNLVIADKIFLDDPLYDAIALVTDPEAFEVSNEVRIATNPVKKKLIPDIQAYIEFYLRAHESLEEKRLVPFKNTRDTIALRLGEIMIEGVTKDPKLQRLLLGSSLLRILVGALPTVISFRFQRVFGKNPNVMSAFESIGFDSYALNWFRLVPLYTSLATFTIGDIKSNSMALFSNNQAYILRRALEAVERFNKDLASNQQLLIPAGISMSGLKIPVLENTPIERVLQIIEREPAAFEDFRATLTEKLASISSPCGTLEREKEIVAIQESIAHDVLRIATLYKGIRNTFSKQFALHMALGIASILVAGLSTVGRNLDALSVAGSVFAGTGLSTSMKEFIQDWLDYQRDQLKLRAEDNYFIWKLDSAQK
ncbi:MAG: hypothetical protein HY070_09095 [Chloroflexi bacterium]|nr:hypothetical protein [Chloroflexota bacterium]